MPEDQEPVATVYQPCRRISVEADACGVPKIGVNVSPFGPLGGVTPVTVVESSQSIKTINKSPVEAAGKFIAQDVEAVVTVVPVASPASITG